MNQTELIIEYNIMPEFDIKTNCKDCLKKFTKEYVESNPDEFIANAYCLCSKTCYRCKRRDNYKFNECICDIKNKINIKAIERQYIINKILDGDNVNIIYNEGIGDNERLVNPEIIDGIILNKSLFDFEKDINIEIVSDKNFIINEIEFEIKTEDEMDELVKGYIEEHILYFNRFSLFQCIKENKKKTVIEEVEVEGDLEIPDAPEIKFNTDDCPVCMESLENTKTFGHCGHCLCLDCFEKVCESKNKVCPICRTEWNYNHYNIEYEEQEVDVDFTQEDIDELCEEENENVLLDIIDIDELLRICINSDGYSHTLGCYVDELNNGNYILSYNFDF
jgi:hypothetical protein